MKTRISTRILALLLLGAMMIGFIPAVIATDSAEASVVEPGETETSTAEQVEPEAPPSPEPAGETPEETSEETINESDVPLSMDGFPLVRAFFNPRMRAATGTMSKSLCTYVYNYISPYWYCNQHYTGTGHTGAHYFYCETIAYHEINGVVAYCIEPNVGSVDAQQYTSYDDGSADSASYWMLELDIEAGLKPVYIIRQPYVHYKKCPKYKGIVGLYYHYLYLLESIEKRQYPPRMTTHMRKTVMQFETLREQFRFLRENDITTQAEMDAYVAGQESKIKSLTKQRTILNVQKKKYQSLFEALADEQALLPAKQLYEDGCLGVEAEFSKYMEAVKLLDECGSSREELASMKSDIYTKLADLNRDIRQARKNIKMCEEIQNRTPQMEKDIKRTEKTKEVKTYEPKQR